MAKERKKLVTEVTKEEHSEVIEEAVSRLLADHQLKHYPQRLNFLKVFTNCPMKEHFVAVLVIMKATYMDLLEKYSKGKKFLQFQNSWFFHVHLYFENLFEVEGINMKRAEELCNYDLKSAKIKGKKAVGEPNCTSDISGSPAFVQFNESTVSLYRYSGFALHSMIETRSKRLSDGPWSKRNEIEILESLKCKHNELNHVQSQVKDLDGGCLSIISPKIIPYVQVLLQNIMSSIGEEQLKTHGHEIIKTAKSSLINHPKLLEKFQLCLDDIQRECSGNVVFESSTIDIVRAEFSDKIFNARINEFFKARKELDLESKTKVVDCDQSLRDKLKTFSSLKFRE